MKYYQLKMNIIDDKEGTYTIHIINDNATCKIKFTPETKELEYLDKNDLTQFIKLKEFQLRKLLHNKKPESFYKGFKLSFVLHDGLPNVNFYDRTKITVLDDRKNQFNIKKTDVKTPHIPELFTDGSFNHEKETGGYAILIKTTNE